MVVEPRRSEGRPEGSSPQTSRKPLIISVAAHVVVFLLVIFGLPHFRTDPEIVDPVPVELIANVSELTATNKPPVKAPPTPEKKEEPPKQVEQKKPPPEPKKSTPPPPTEEDLKEPPKPEKTVEKPAEKVDDLAEKKVEPKKPEPKKEPPKKDPPKKQPEKKQDKPDTKENQQDFDSLLKDLTPEEKKQQEADEKTDKETPATPSPNVSRFSDTLSISEMDALRQQLSQCWSVMSGAQDAGDQIVEMSVVVNEDRTVASAKVVDDGKYNSNPVFRAAADSAMRALRNPNCTPLNLPPDKYTQWHEMTIVFDPKEMF